MIIEILQDSAAVINKNGCVVGIYTEEFETCSIIIIESLNKLLIVHDSTQLDINHISKEIKKLGTVIKVNQLVNSNYMFKSEDNLYYATHGKERGESFRAQQSKRHKDRLLKIIKKSNIKVEPVYNSTRNARLIISSKNILNDNDTVIDKLLLALTPLPDKEKRKAIIQLNNIFLEANSQKLPLDLEFDIEGYTKLPSLLKNHEEMEKIALKMKIDGDDDYFNVLNRYSHYSF
ncbi:hypothetical protein [Lelliottia wanjuensis]|uniref:hypothetical protein n=1 Tax=Lelliottia wanjuensis TaxID=3050585 RepID=UPI002550F20F|nr:hypothetical protein [Lelliottia sp. V86_10]MDK9585734.1 hypothetical protein [Lelliottia sp. V86_10]